MSKLFLQASEFVLDSGVFIEAHRRIYPFDVFPSFWCNLCNLVKSGKAVTIEPVWHEIKEGKDKLTDWFEKHILPHTYDIEDIQECYSKVANCSLDFAINHGYRQRAIDDFLDGADPWVIAFAMRYKLTVVTQEHYNSEIRRKIPIPVICEFLNVDWCNTIEMFRRLKIKF